MIYQSSNKRNVISDHPLKQCPYNTAWIKVCFGEEVLKAFMGKSISCAGLTFASGRFVLQYLRTVIESMKKAKCRELGIDQGTHNYVVHSNLIPEAKFIPFHNPHVVNMHWLPPDTRIVIEDHQAYLDVKGSRSLLKVWHQYDRHAVLVEFSIWFGKKFDR